MRKNSHILITAAAALMLSFSVFPAYAATTGAIVGAPGAGISTEQASAPTSAGAAVPTTAAETKSAWESAAALEEVEKTGFVPALPLGDSIFSTPTGSGQTSETKAPETTAAKSTAAAETQAPVETTAAKTTAAAEMLAPAETTARLRPQRQRRPQRRPQQQRLPDPRKLWGLPRQRHLPQRQRPLRRKRPLRRLKQLLRRKLPQSGRRPRRKALRLPRNSRER